MADDDQDLEIDVAEGAAAGGGGKKKLMIIIIAAAVLLIGGGVAAFLLLGGEEALNQESEVAKEEIKLPPIYVGVPNALTANIAGGGKRGRTLQIKASFMIREPDGKAIVNQHMPQLRNDILMLISRKTADELKVPTGRVKLQEEALVVVQKTLTDIAERPIIEKVLFVSYVMQ